MSKKTLTYASVIAVLVLALGDMSSWADLREEALRGKLSRAAQQISAFAKTAITQKAEADEEDEPELSDQEKLNKAYKTEDINQWKQYKNKKMNIAFRYPASLSVRELRNSIKIIDPSKDDEADESRPIIIRVEKGRMHDLAAKYIGFNSKVQWNPHSESSRAFALNAARIPHFTGDTSRYNTYLFPKGFIDVNRIPPVEAAQWTPKRIQNQMGTLLVADTVSNEDGDEFFQQIEELKNADLYQDLPSRILSTLRFLQ